MPSPNATKQLIHDIVSTVRVVTADTTLTGNDNGKTIIANSATGLTITLPSVANNLSFTLVVGTLPTSGQHVLSPNAVDSINGGTDDKDIIAASSGDVLGDSVTVVGDRPNGTWWTKAMHGIWTIEG